MITMQRVGSILGTFNGYRYVGRASTDRPVEHYTPRIVPYHAEAFLPLEAPEVFWR